MKLNLLKFFCLVSVSFMVLSCSEEGLGTLTVVNQSEEMIILLHVKVHENIHTVKDLRHGEEAEMQFPVKFDTHYHIEIEFISGRKIRKDVGYLTRNSRVADKVIINKADIEFETMSVETPELY